MAAGAVAHKSGHGLPMETTAGEGWMRLEPVEGPPVEAVVLGSPQRLDLGRSGGCGVVMMHGSVSRRHSAVLHEGGRWRVCDLGSRNGTYLNGVRLEPDERLPLADGDLIRLGAWVLLVRLPAPPEPPEAPGEAESGHVEAPPAAITKPPQVARTGETYATRASIFLRLADRHTDMREVGWQEFADRYGPVIVGFARNAGLPAQDADDVLQEVLLGFFRVSPTFEYDPSRGRFRGYLKRVTLNAMRVRRRRERGMRPVGGVEEIALPAGVDVVWDHQWMMQVLRRALDEVAGMFEPRTLEAFELYGRRGLPAEAVAEQIGMSVESVRHAKSRVSRALREVVERIRGQEA
jgi:RNA polymerase sigma-70 factor (ECF subfamily)